MIIGLSGPKGSGKSTASAVFIKKGFEIISFSNSLKNLCHEVFNLPLELFLDPSKKEVTFATPVTLTNDIIIRLLTKASNTCLYIPAHIQAKAIKLCARPSFKTPRELLQFVGSDLFRDLVNLDYWTKTWEAKIKPNKDYICDDVRFGNESSLIQNKYKGKVIKINRLGLESKDAHQSETQAIEADYTVLNSDLALFNKDIGIVIDLIKGESSGKTFEGQER